MSIPVGELREFFDRIDQAVTNACKRSKGYLREWKYNEVKSFLDAKFPDDEIHFYGSRMMGLANHYSDLDIYINSCEDSDDAISYLASKMDQSPNWQVQVALYKARCPVLRCIYLPWNLKCDIQFEQPMAVIQTQLVRHLFDIQPEAVKFFHAIRIWLEICEVKFKRFQLVLLVIFFLQQHNLMPSIQNMQKRLPRATLGVWDIQFDDERDLCDYDCYHMGDFNDYLQEFFEFYSNFDFESCVVFPYTGYCAPKDNYSNSSQLRRFDFDCSAFKSEKPMAVAGLLTFHCNITQDVGKNRLAHFIAVCEESASLLNYRQSSSSSSSLLSSSSSEF